MRSFIYSLPIYLFLVYLILLCNILLLKNSFRSTIKICIKTCITSSLRFLRKVLVMYFKKWRSRRKRTQSSIYFFIFFRIYLTKIEVPVFCKGVSHEGLIDFCHFGVADFHYFHRKIKNGKPPGFRTSGIFDCSRFSQVTGSYFRINA